MAKSLQQQLIRYESLAESAFQMYILPEKDIVSYADILNRISLDAELQVGASDFTEFRNETSQNSQNGLIGDFFMRMEYRINTTSEAAIFAQNSSDIIQTPYRNTDFGGAYNGQIKNLKWRSGITYSKYQDKFNTFNNYNRIGLNLTGEQKLTGKTSLQANYLLNSNNYTDFSGIELYESQLPYRRQNHYESYEKT